LRTAFEEAVDDYLDLCEQTGKSPEKPFKGTFNIRLDPSLHQRLVAHAIDEGKTLNTFIKEALKRLSLKHVPEPVGEFERLT
jgi:predicted HicB family RNase H-like nuclease